MEFPRQVYLIYRKNHEERGVRGPSPRFAHFYPQNGVFWPASRQPGPSQGRRVPRQATSEIRLDLPAQHASESALYAD